MLASLFSKPQPSLSVQAKRLVAMRFLIYTGFQTSYFIGVIGTLTYADGASVVATSLAVLFMNVFVILGSFAGGAALDAWGPRHHFLLSIVGALTTGVAIIAFGGATGIVLLGAVLLGFVMGFAQPIATSYPAYLTDDPVELKDINSTITMFSNVSIIVGPTLGGFIAAAASSRAVFVLMMLFTLLALIAGWGFKPQAVSTAGHADADSAEEGKRAGQSPNPNTSVRGRGSCRPDRPGRGLGRRQPAPQHHCANDGPARAARPRQLGHGLWKHVRRRGSAGDCPVAGGDIWRAADARRSGHSRNGGPRGAAAVWT